MAWTVKSPILRRCTLGLGPVKPLCRGEPVSAIRTLSASGDEQPGRGEVLPDRPTSYTLCRQDRRACAADTSPWRAHHRRRDVDDGFRPRSIARCDRASDATVVAEPCGPF